MLDKKHITNIPMLSEAWRMGRLAKFTASEIHYLMGEKPFTVGAMSYIYRKVGEELTGLPCRDQVDSIATEHGHKFEEPAIKLFAEIKGINILVTQKLIFAPDTRCSCTPDVIIPISESEDKLFWQVETGEVKCPLSYDAYIGLARCKTPEDIKKENKIYYWQKLDQMDNCDALKGYFIIYHPFFKAGGINIVDFRKKDLILDFKLLKERKLSAVAKFNEVRDELLNLKY